MYQQVAYTVQSSYAISQNPTGKEQEIWIVFHGYGQLAPYFLKKFEHLFREDRVIVAPEATNYGYLKGFSGRVGANWMTKHQRELAISNNHHFLNALTDKLLSCFKNTPKLKVLGFSQGAAMASRWITQLTYPLDTLVLWGGGFAHDLDIDKAKSKLKHTEIKVVWGNDDPFITPARISEQQEVMDQLGLKQKKISYQGGHDLDPSLLQDIFG